MLRSNPDPPDGMQNVDGKEKILYALTSIKGIGRRFADLVCKKAEVDQSKR